MYKLIGNSERYEQSTTRKRVSNVMLQTNIKLFTAFLTLATRVNTEARFCRARDCGYT